VTDRHPDTGASIIGFQVPRWAEILDMACRVSRAVGMGYLGVDIVLDHHQGPLLLEANARPGLAIQIANGKGLLPRLAEIDRTLAEQPPRPVLSAPQMVHEGHP
jgi:glutathione synthase/RimK-type ligase-like ATP-grasp enzyme